MSNCKKCNSKIPYRMKIDERLVYFPTRKYCLECSPFGQHNTRKICNGLSVGLCKDCGKTFNYNRKKGNRSHTCASCLVAKYRKNVKKRLVEYAGGTCTICGYDKSINALQFHHKNPSEKNFTIAGKTTSFNKLKAEVDKCILICANCHSELHENLITKTRPVVD